MARHTTLIVTSIGILASLSSWWLVSSLSSGGSSASEEIGQQDSIPHPLVYEVVLAGDVMCHGPQIAAARGSDGSYDFSSSFDSIAPLVHSADLAIANLETTLGERPYTGYPRFSSPVALAEALKDSGFDILTTSNNHSADRSSKGIVRTIGVLDSLGLAHTGSYRSAEERELLAPLMYQLGELRLAIMAYTYDTNGLPVPSPTLVDRIDTALIARDIARADSLGADYKLVQMHWGNEYQRSPSREQRSLAKWLHEQGVNAVIGSHPHVVQESEVLSSSNQSHSTLVIYSLGNFVSNQKSPASTRGGMLLGLTLRRETPNSPITTEPSYQWTFVMKKNASGKALYRIQPIDLYSDKLPAGLAYSEQADYKAFCQYYKTISFTTSIVTTRQR